jgi:tRNA pseudouridine38-40 synthase
LQGIKTFKLEKVSDTMMKNILLTIEYDGTDFCGWQKQPHQRSVQGEIEDVLSILCSQPIKINGTSRTDAGVHALGQRANFKGDFQIPVDRIQKAANNLLSARRANHRRATLGAVGDIQITEVRQVPLDFHARFDAVGKKYIYLIDCAPEKNIFRRNYAYQFSKDLDIEGMNAAAKAMVGRHDFKCFQAAGGKELETTVREIYSLKLIEENPQESCLQALAKQASPKEAASKRIRLEIIGDGFLYNMVRIITGTLLDVGIGKMRADAIPEIILSRDRQRAGHTAPPQGLYLAEVYFDIERMKQARHESY